VNTSSAASGPTQRQKARSSSSAVVAAGLT
jgi:hypothetical protein